MIKLTKRDIRLIKALMAEFEEMKPALAAVLGAIARRNKLSIHSKIDALKILLAVLPHITPQ